MVMYVISYIMVCMNGRAGKTPVIDSHCLFYRGGKWFNTAAYRVEGLVYHKVGNPKEAPWRLLTKGLLKTRGVSSLILWRKCRPCVRLVKQLPRAAFLVQEAAHFQQL